MAGRSLARRIVTAFVLMTLVVAGLFSVTVLMAVSHTEENYSSHTMNRQLDDILKYMEKLAEVPTDHVEPMTGTVELYTPMREDVVRPSLPVEEALSNAPARAGTSFRVPKVIE